MTSKFLARTLMAAAALTALSFSTLAAATPPSVGAYSEGLLANISVASLIGLTVGPLDYAGGVAPAPFTSSQQLLNFSSSTDLILGSFDVTAGIIDDTASSGYPPALSGTATSTVSGLTTGLTIPALASLFTISATTLTSTTTASDPGVVMLTGSSEIENLDISGLALGSDPILISGVVAPSINDILLATPNLLIVANSQLPLQGSTIDFLQTSALRISFTDFAFNGALLNGTVLIANTAAAIANAPPAVPEPASWAMMLIGMGLVGAVARSRRVLALA